MDDLERHEGLDQKEGPKLRTANNSMRAFTGSGTVCMYVCMFVRLYPQLNAPLIAVYLLGDHAQETVGMRSARLSVVGGDSSGMCSRTAYTFTYVCLKSQYV